jgi:hypothetical protein
MSSFGPVDTPSTLPDFLEAQLERLFLLTIYGVGVLKSLLGKLNHMHIYA